MRRRPDQHARSGHAEIEHLDEDHLLLELLAVQGKGNALGFVLRHGLGESGAAPLDARLLGDAGIVAVDRFGQRAPPDGLDELTRSPWTDGNPDIESLDRRPAQGFDQLADVSADAETSRDIVGGPRRQNRYQSFAVFEVARYLSDGAVSARHDHDVGGLGQRFIELAVLARTICCGEARGIEGCQQVLTAQLSGPDPWIVHEPAHRRT
jgi:hypothetical protein